MGSRPVAVVIMHVHKYEIRIHTHTPGRTPPNEGSARQLHNTTNTRDECPFPHWDRNPRSQELRLIPDGHRDRLQHLFSQSNTNLDSTFYTEDSPRMPENTHNKYSLFDSKKKR